jgi:pyruvate dehydrogenase E2 component (dihydrolipoamide acetyltransferase)
LSQLQEIKIPDIGTDASVDVIEILVKVGDRIQCDDPIMTLESEKASMDIPSPLAGVVASLAVKVGDKVGKGQVVLTLSTDPLTVKNDTPAVSSLAAPEVTQADVSTASAHQTLCFPDLGTTAAVDVIELLVKLGDAISVDLPLVTLEGEKASMDVPSTVQGQLIRFLVKVGDKVKSGDPFAEVAVSQTASAPVSLGKDVTASTPSISSHPVKDISLEKTTSVSSISEADDMYAGPAVRRLARELGIDLALIQGTGRKSRIQLEDLHAYVKPIMAEVQRGEVPRGSSGGLSLPKVPDIDHSQFGDIEVKALSKIQKISGPNLQRNWIVVPHVTQFEEADISSLETFRKTQNDIYKAKGIKITLLPFIMKSVVAALKAYPKFNTSLSADGNNLIFKKYFHIGVAVDTPNGLVVAVIRDVDKKGVVEISQELMDVSEKARTKGLTLREMQGSSFTISSLGGIGGTAFTPIVNLPDVAILGVSRSQIKPVYENGEFVPRLMLPLSLSYDHRVIDGADGARFASFLARTLGDIRTLML